LASRLSRTCLTIAAPSLAAARATNDELYSRVRKHSKHTAPSHELPADRPMASGQRFHRTVLLDTGALQGWAFRKKSLPDEFDATGRGPISMPSSPSYNENGALIRAAGASGFFLWRDRCRPSLGRVAAGEGRKTHGRMMTREGHLKWPGFLKTTRGSLSVASYVARARQQIRSS